MANPNLDLLIAMAWALGPLRERVVFVGGCATGLLLTQAAVADIRPTEDVDAIVEVATLASYHALTQELAVRGFRQTMEDNTPPFRWFWQRMQLDLVPLDEKIMGFATIPGTARVLMLPWRSNWCLGWYCGICQRLIFWRPNSKRSMTAGTMTSI